MYIDLTLNIKNLFLKDDAVDIEDKDFIKSGHYGTHIDIHLKSEIPLDYMVSRGVLFDVSSINGRDIEIFDIDTRLIENGDCLIFKTDKMKAFPYGTKEYFMDHPQLSHDLIDYLIESKIRIIGIDTAGIRRGKEHVLADKQCESKGIYVIENLDNLDELHKQTNQSFQVHLMWLSLPGKTGLPCRIVAWLPN